MIYLSKCLIPVVVLMVVLIVLVQQLLFAVVVVNAFHPKIQLSSIVVNHGTTAFIQSNYRKTTVTTTKTTTRKETNLFAIGVLAKKAKLASLRDYIKNNPIDDTTQDYINKIKEAKMKNMQSSNNNNNNNIVSTMESQKKIGILRESLIRRRGTVTIIAEYKRKLSNGNTISDVYIDPTILSSVFRDYGASAVAVMADERMGGCTYNDIDIIVEEQRRANQKVPGPIPIINNDLIIDEYQIALSATKNISGCVVQYTLIQDTLHDLLIAANACNIELIVAVSNPTDAQAAIDAGARLINVINVDTMDDRAAIINTVQVPTTSTSTNDPVCFICTIGPRLGSSTDTNKNSKNSKNSSPHEIEEAWAIRDMGYHCVWVGEVLYKVIGSSLADQSIEHPGAIIRSMKSKSSLKYASPKATTGRGEGAREYLGDILM